MRPNSTRSLIAGTVALAVAIALSSLAPLIGFPNLDMGTLLGMIFNRLRPPETFSILWWCGMTTHLAMGIVVFPLTYDALYQYLSGPDWFRGVVWSVALWFAMGIFLTPMMGLGWFFLHAAHPALMAFGTFGIHVVYGAVLGTVAGHGVSNPDPGLQSQLHDGRPGHA